MTSALDQAIRAHLERLLRDIEEDLGEPVPERIQDAFRAAPRHRFLDRFRTSAEGAWQQVTAGSLAAHLSVIYRNTGLGIDGEGHDDGVTISQPAMVARMLALLDLQPGQRVFEVGAGSGWNAALMGHLVAPGGAVETVEIREGLAERARAAIARCGLAHVVVRTGDAGADLAQPDQVFDRAVFTAGAHDIPRSLHGAIAPDGLLLFVWKMPGGGDFLVLFGREGDGFASREVRRCEFVPMRGANAGAAPVESPEWFEPRHALRAQVAVRRPFPIGVPGWRSFALRSWLWITEPRARFFHSVRGPAFGLWLEDAGSLALLQGGELVVFGTPAAGDALERSLSDWARRGMPDASDMEIRAYPIHSAPAPAAGEWIVRRPSTVFVCRLPG